MKLRILTALLFTSLNGIVLAAADPVTIEAPWVRLTAPGIKTTGAFMAIRNAGTTDRRIVKAESPAAAIVELHDHINDNGVMKMRAVPNIPVKAGGQAELKPGSYHVMLIDLREPLQEGASIPITLHFDDNTQRTVQAIVRNPAAAPTHGMHKH